MIILGLALLIIGFIASIPILWTIGIIVLVVGLILALLGAVGHAVGGRRHYYSPPTLSGGPAANDPPVRPGGNAGRDSRLLRLRTAAGEAPHV